MQKLEINGFTGSVEQRASTLYQEHQEKIYKSTDRLFAGLMFFQWIGGIVAAYWISPLTWSGEWSQTHIHIWSAVLLGGVISFVPIGFALFLPGKVVTRHVIAVGQMLTSALLIHLTGGRIETHFHVFGSLAFLAFYRNWPVLISATIIVALDHIIRGIYWPQSVFGVIDAGQWRWLEHAAWVIFEDIFLMSSCVRGVTEMKNIAAQRAQLEAGNWLNKSETQLNEQLRGDQDSKLLAKNLVFYLVKHFKASIGAVYIFDTKKQKLKLVEGYAHSEQPNLAKEYNLGEGLIGQTAKEKKLMQIKNNPDNSIHINCGVGTVSLRHVVVVPFASENKVNVVVVLAATEEFTELHIEFLQKISENVAIFFNSADARREMKTLLGEVKLKSEALQIQNEEILKQQKELDQQNKKLEVAYKHKSEFLASMSHELRTPLNAMIGYTSLTLNALKESLPSNHLQNLTNAEHSARTLLQLINGILDFSKIEAGKMEIFIEEVDLEEVIEDCMCTAEGLVINKTIEVKEFVASDLPLIESDYTKLKQIITNIVSNAIKFTEKGHCHIKANKTKDGNAIYIEIEDTGSGIPKETIGNIFESFKQVDGSIKKRFGGTGLGLAITQKLCEILGTEIGLKSEIGKGTTFWLIVPIQLQTRTIQPIITTIKEETKEEEVVVKEETGKRNKDAFEKISYSFQTQQKKATISFVGSAKTYANLKRLLSDFPIEIYHQTIAECVEIAEIQHLWSIVIESETGTEISQLQKKGHHLNIPKIICCKSENKDKGLFGSLEYIQLPLEKKELIEALYRIAKMRKGDVLVVEDDALSRELYGKVLLETGYAPHLVEDGAQAIEFLSQKLPQAIILDLLMPEINGFEVLKAIEENFNWKKIPVVIVTGKELNSDERKILQKGTQNLLEKGRFETKEISNKIVECIKDIEAVYKRSILVIDDHEMNLNIISEIFNTAGYDVYKSNSGPKGIEAALEKHPDVILMDLAMPGMDGFEATEELKQTPSLQKIPVIACSAFATSDFKNKAFACGCEGYITKPVEPIRLVEQIKQSIIVSKIRNSLWQRS